MPAFGCRPATSFLASIEPSILNPSNGAIKVNPHMQVMGQSPFPNIFAAGDAIDWDEQNQSMHLLHSHYIIHQLGEHPTNHIPIVFFSTVGKTGRHAGVVIANILKYLAGKPPSKVYKGARESINLTIGKVRPCLSCSFHVHLSIISTPSL